MKQWEIKVKNKVTRRLRRLPSDIQDKALALMLDLRKNGIHPSKRWKNFSRLTGEKYHCHLSYSYVACWEIINEEIHVMEVYYVGSREDAPY